MIKKKEYIYLALIVVLGMALIIFYGMKKQVYDGDELYSYLLSNSNKGGFITDIIKIDEWHSPQFIKDIFALNSNEIFSFFSVYKNQANDVHPPFFYLIFHLVSIFFLNKFSVLPGLIINIICYVILMIYLYKISKQIMNKGALIPCLLYTISLGMIGTALFIRMYMMVTTIAVVFTYYFLAVTQKMNKKNLLLLAICTYLGFMCHYFFLVYAFFIGLIYLIYLLTTKNKRNIIHFMEAMIIPVITGFLTFPFAFKHIFKGYRGTETQENLIKSNIIENFKKIYQRLNIDLFDNIMPIIIILFVILIILFIKKRSQKEEHKVFFVTITISTILYFILTLKIIPIISVRYFYLIYPLTILIGYYLIDKGMSNKYVKTGIISVFVILSIVTQVNNKPLWLEESNLLKKMDKKIIYVVENEFHTITDAQFLMYYNDIYFTNEQFNNYEMIDEIDQDIIVKTNNLDFMDKVILNTKFNKYEQQEFGYLLVQE